MSIKIDVVITGAIGQDTRDKLTRAIRGGLQDHVNATEWHLRMSHRPFDMDQPQEFLRANNVK